MPNVKARISNEIQSSNDKENRGRINFHCPGIILSNFGHFGIPLSFEI